MALLRPEQVFTPRAPQINREMYIDRPDIERRLAQSLDGNKFIITHGESGNGKTWLYKKVFEEKQVSYEVLNLASANLHESILPIFEEKLGELGVENKERVETIITSGVRPWNVGVDVQNKTQTQIIRPSILSTLFEKMRERAGDRPCILVFDNFEQIEKSDNIVKQIASILILADDDIVSKHNVKIMIVGVPSNIRSLISRSTNAATIVNRVTEIPEVARLTKTQGRDLLSRGLEASLGIKIQDAEVYDQMIWHSDLIAQHLHEVGLSVARQAINNGRILTVALVDEAISEWAAESLSADCTIIEDLMNSRETKVGRKNQTLFALGQCEEADFKYTEIETIVKTSSRSRLF